MTETEIRTENGGILVCLSPSPSNRHVIRTALKVSRAMHAPLTAVFVGDMKAAEKNPVLSENIRFARENGAAVHIIPGGDIALAIAEFAERLGVSDLFVGNSVPSGLIESRRTLPTKLLHYLPGIDIHIIPDELATQPPQRLDPPRRPRLSLRDFLILAVIMTMATLLSVWFDQSRFSNANIITIYILAVLVTSILTSDRIYGLLAAILYILLFNFLFITPRFTLLVYDSEYLMTYFVTVVAALMTGSLAARMKNIVHQSIENAYQAKVLLDTSNALQKAENENEAISITCRQLTDLLKKDILFFPFASSVENRKEFPYGKQHSVPFPAEEEKILAWVKENDRRAGAFTRQFPECGRQYLSLHTNRQIFGVIAVSMENDQLSEYENTLLLSILSECALTLETMRSAREQREAEQLMLSERFRSGLLRSISHDLRTPLTSISGNASTLVRNAKELSDEEKETIYADIEEDAAWLNTEMENILTVTRLENSRYLNMTVENIRDVITESLRHCDRNRTKHQISVDMEDEYMMAEMDAGMITLVLINLINNAVKYTPEGSHITISAAKKDRLAEISVSDDGGGISDEDKEHVFEAFYTAAKPVSDGRRSLGLGLNLCAMIIRAHGKEITVRDNVPHGTVFTFTLNAKEVPE